MTRSSSVGEHAYGVEAAGEFGGEGDHPGVAAGGVDELADQGRVGVAQQVGAVGPAAARRDERALEVDAGEDAVLDEFGEYGGLAGDLVDFAGDGRGDRGGGAVLQVGAGGAQRLLGDAGGVGGAAAAVDVQVDEAGHDGVPGQVEVARLGPTARDGCDAGSLDGEAVPLDDADGQDQSGAGQGDVLRHAHVRLQVLLEVA